MPKESFRHNIFFFAFVREPFIIKCFVLIIIIITIIYNKNLITNILYRVVNDWRQMYIYPVNELLRFFFFFNCWQSVQKKLLQWSVVYYAH